MANRHLSHIKSNQTVTSSENGVTTVSPKLPTTQQILYGEIAINYAKGYEKLAIKNNNDEIVTFPTDQQIEMVEKVISAALNDLDGRVVELNTGISSIEGQQIDNILWDTDGVSGQVTLKLRHNNGDSTYTNIATVQVPYADNSGNTGVISGTGSGLTLNSGQIGLDIQSPLYITPDEELSVQNASTSQFGVVKIGNGINVSNGVISVASASNLSLGQGYAICNTQASTAAKSVSLTGYQLEDGGIVSIKFIYDVPASATLNINNKGAGSIYYRGTAITDGVIKGGDVATMMYYSGNYYLIGNDRWDESKINSISINGTAQAITNKNVDLEVPKIKTFNVSSDSTFSVLNFGNIKFSDIEDAFDNYDQVFINLTEVSVEDDYDVSLRLLGVETYDTTSFGKGFHFLSKENYFYTDLTVDVLITEGSNDTIVYTVNTYEYNMQSDWEESDLTSPAYINNKPIIGDATLTIQKNSTTLDTFNANATTNKTINISVPVASDYLGSFDLSIDSSTYVMTLQGKDGAGNNKGTAQTIDLPLETMVVNGSYDSTNQKIVLTLKNGTTVDIPIGALINGLQAEITSSNKLSADLVEDGNTNKVYTATEKTKLSGIAEGAEVNVQANWNETSSSSDAYIQNKPTIGTATITIQKNGTTVDTFTVNDTSAKTINISNVQDTLSANNKLNADYIQDGISNKVFTAEYKDVLDGIDDRFDALIENDEKIEKVTASALNDLNFRIENVETATVDGVSYENVTGSGGRVSITHTDSGTTTTVDSALIPVVTNGQDAVNGLMTPAMLTSIETLETSLDTLEEIVEEAEEVTANSLVELDGRITSVSSTITELEQTVEDNELVTATALNTLNDDISGINGSISVINTSLSSVNTSISSINTSISSINNAIDDIEQDIDDFEFMKEVTYSQLVALKNGGNLVPGMKYRITDYQTILTEDYNGYAVSAGHQFDIVVTALSSNELSESASAVRHSGDTYFANSNLGAWELKYTIVNDTTKLINPVVADTMVDTQNGKGVIYSMKDGNGNECSFDFKNIMCMNENINEFCYTFYNLSTESNETVISDGSLGNYFSNNKVDKMSNFINNSGHNNIMEKCQECELDGGCYNNTFWGVTSCNLGSGCFSNNFSDCEGITFGESCRGCRIDSCYGVNFGSYCEGCSFDRSISIWSDFDSQTGERIGHFKNLNVKGNNNNIGFIDATDGTGEYFQNIVIEEGTNTSNIDELDIELDSRDNEFTTTYKNPNSVTVYVTAD